MYLYKGQRFSKEQFFSFIFEVFELRKALLQHNNLNALKKVA